MSVGESPGVLRRQLHADQGRREAKGMAADKAGTAVSVRLKKPSNP